MNITQEQPDEGDAQGRYGARPQGSHHSPLSPMSMCSPTQELSEPHPTGVLWKNHYIGTIE